MAHDDYATAKESFNKAETVHHMIQKHKPSREGFAQIINDSLEVKGNLNVLNRVSGLSDFSLGDNSMAVFNGPVAIQPGGRSRLFVANDGKVGIGTMMPMAELDLQGGMNISGNLNVKTINGVLPGSSSSSSSSTAYGQTNLSVNNPASGWPNGTTKLIDTAWADGTDTVNYYTPGSITNKPALTLKANGNNVISGNLQVGGTITPANVQVTNGFNAPKSNATLYGVTLDAAGINSVAGKGTMLPVRASLDMGADDTTREANAGKIAYGNEWDPASFNFVGKGKPGENRQIHLWDDVIVDNRMRAKNRIWSGDDGNGGVWVDGWNAKNGGQFMGSRNSTSMGWYHNGDWRVWHDKNSNMLNSQGGFSVPPDAIISHRAYDDKSQGLTWAWNRSFRGLPANTVDGPALNGWNGGLLGTNDTSSNKSFSTDGTSNWALRWTSGGNVGINNNLDANVLVNRGTDFLLGTSDGGADNKGGRGNFANGMTHGRAMVKYARNNADGTKSPQLHINWANDFPAGVVINGPLTSTGDTEITGNLTVRGTINGSPISGGGSSSAGGGGASMTAEDNRQIKPINLAPRQLQYGFGNMANNPGDATYADTLHFNSYVDGSGGRQNVMMLDKTKIGMRVYQAPFQDQNPYQQYKDAVMTDTNSTDVTVGGTLKANALSSATSVSLPNWKLQEDSNGGLCFNKNNTNVFCVNGQGKLYK